MGENHPKGQKQPNEFWNSPDYQVHPPIDREAGTIRELVENVKVIFWNMS